MAKKSTFKEVRKGTEKKLEDLHITREKRCVPIAHAILEVIAESKLKLGKLDPKDYKGYDESALRIITLMLEKNINYSDKNFIFQLVMQAVEQTQDTVIRNLEKSFDFALDKKFGKPYSDVKMSDIDNILKSK